MAFEKVNMYHPDKVADRIAGALVDYCYTQHPNTKTAIEVLIGHGLCTIVAESVIEITEEIARPIVDRIAGEGLEIKVVCTPQDVHLARNQAEDVRCGDNGIFKGMPITDEEMELTKIAQELSSTYKSDGKYILDGNKLIVCQSNCDSEQLANELHNKYPEFDIVVNPLGDWTGGTMVDAGATNRKLGSDAGPAVMGCGYHGKDLSKADVSVSIYCFLEAQRTKKQQNAFCAIGDKEVNVNGIMIPYAEIVKTAKTYIDQLGGFEVFAEWGLW